MDNLNEKEKEIEIKKQIKKLRQIAIAIVIIPMIIFLIIFVFLIKSKAMAYDYDERYGVFIGIGRKDIDKLNAYQTVVIDAEHFTKADITKLKKAGKTVYTYLSVGSLEDFRSYYKAYKHLAISKYDGWEGEEWADVSAKSWQKLMLKRAKEFKKKGVDGFFIDNADVYYEYKEPRIYKGLVKILTDIRKLNAKVIINGGDVFVSKYLQENKTLKKIADGVNQEGVFTTLVEDKKKGEEITKYYLNYLTKLSKKGIHIYLTEYIVEDNKDDGLEDKIADYCKERGWDYYISYNYELD
ncbi:MAG: endo alpha-1,4 polygalactosaminidase [Catonella sp.]|uniref:endo alpha-1,4 polygalactosaminidase n=1 Tax=Catonella sp. TaxID=2382125 RepID=UPI003FA11FE6